MTHILKVRSSRYVRISRKLCVRPSMQETLSTSRQNGTSAMEVAAERRWRRPACLFPSQWAMSCFPLPDRHMVNRHTTSMKNSCAQT